MDMQNFHYQISSAMLELKSTIPPIQNLRTDPIECDYDRRSAEI